MIDKTGVQLGVVGGATAVQSTGILTLEQLNNIGILGISYGAWVSILFALSALVIILLNIKKLYIEILKPIAKFTKKFIEELYFKT